MPEIYSTLIQKQRHTHGMSGTPIYQVWRDMKQRVNNSNSRLYKDYGGRGIKVCKRWQDSFVEFHKDMGDRPSPKYSLDRINVDGDYTPENCRWATKHQQTQNQRLRVTNTTGYRGVSRVSAKNRTKKFWVEIGGVNIGYFATAEEGARAYDKVAIEKYGSHAKTNFEVASC